MSEDRPMGKIKVMKDGPYIVTGCGASKNKPFCDGAHVSRAFKSGR